MNTEGNILGRITNIVFPPHLFQERKRAVTVHVSDGHGDKLQGAEITAEQVSKDFPFGSAIAKTILGNVPYQVLLQPIKLFLDKNMYIRNHKSKLEDTRVLNFLVTKVDTHQMVSNCFRIGSLSDSMH